LDRAEAELALCLVLEAIESRHPRIHEERLRDALQKALGRGTCSLKDIGES
jgi:hypothetical protein